MGRKKLSKKVVRAKPLRVLLNLEERRLIEEAAHRDGFESVSAWARRLMLKESRRTTEGA